MKPVRVLLTAVATVGASSAFASNGLQLIGFSLKQMALGGAVTANPQTPATVFTNPAGLRYVPDETEFSLGFAFPSIKAGFPAAGVTDKSMKDFQMLPSVALATPLKGERMRFGLGVGLIAGSGVDFSWPELQRSAFSDLQILRIAPALSYNLSEKTTIGAALNLNIGRVNMANEGFGPSTLPAAFSRGTEMVGLGTTLGVMHDATENVRIGASYTSATNFPNAEYPSAVGTYEGDFEFPQQWALGVCVNPDKPTTFSLDLKWIDYSKSLGDLIIYGPGLPAGGANLDPNWKDQTVVALGVTHKFDNGLTLRAGYNHGNKPFDAKNTAKNILLAAIATDHYTFGLDYRLDDRWTFNSVLIYQPESTVTDGAVKISNRNTTIGLGATVRF